MGETNPLMNFPDDLLCSHILSRLPLKEAVRFSAVSRKWWRVWTCLRHLKFSVEFCDSVEFSIEDSISLDSIADTIEDTIQDTIADIISKIIVMQCAGVEVFEVYNCDMFERNIHDWTLCVALKGMKRIHLESSDTLEVPSSLFYCETLVSLSLKKFKMTKMPALFHGFSQLVTCFLKDVELSEKAFEGLLRLCCLLERLTVIECRISSKKSHWRIYSSSLKSLTLSKLSGSLIANCPRLELIKIINCYCLKDFKVWLPVCLHLVTDIEHLNYFRTTESLKKIKCYGDSFGGISRLDISILQYFSHMEELCIVVPKIQGFISEDVIKEDEWNLPIRTFILALYGKRGYRKTDLLFMSYILENAPVLKTVRVNINNFKKFMKLDGFQLVYDLLDFQRRFPQLKFNINNFEKFMELDGFHLVNDLLDFQRRFPQLKFLLSRRE